MVLAYSFSRLSYFCLLPKVEKGALAYSLQHQNSFTFLFIDFIRLSYRVGVSPDLQWRSDEEKEEKVKYLVKLCKEEYFPAFGKILMARLPQFRLNSDPN